LRSNFRPTRKIDLPKTVGNYLTELVSDLRDYRACMKRIFSRKLTRSRDCSKYFFEVLVCASNLYRDHLTMRKLEAELYNQAKRPPNKPAGTYSFKRRAGVDHEATMRPRFRRRIESLHCWTEFQPESEFAEENQLRTVVNYISALALHLPEIYGETINMDRSVKKFSESRASSAVAEIQVGLAHIAHHASYCHFALETLSEEWRWRPLPEHTRRILIG